MSIDIGRLLRAPTIFNEIREMSFSETLYSCGITNESMITEKDLIDSIMKEIHIVDIWINYSSDQRIDQGSFFRAVGQEYQFGFLDKKGHIESVYLGTDPVYPCALFIMDKIRELFIDYH